MISQYLRSQCCGAQLISVYEMAPDRTRMFCAKCHSALGVMLGEDQRALLNGDIPRDIYWDEASGQYMRHTDAQGFLDAMMRIGEVYARRLKVDDWLTAEHPQTPPRGDRKA
jgi:hypothetical protein